ncbi:Tetratricopeptide repeat protein [compost metagenome]
MFRDAAQYFREAVKYAPEDNFARMFLAMTCMHLQEWHEAQRHFQLLVELTDHPRWRALGYNALGCIQAVRMNLEQAEHYFMKAHETDPDFTEPLSNLQSCQQHEGQISLFFGSGQL